MKTVIVNHEVKNYAEWRKVYDADKPNRVKAGFITSGEYQSVEDPNNITIIGEAPSVEAIQGFMSDPALKAAMEKGGVIGLPNVKILDKV